MPGKSADSHQDPVYQILQHSSEKKTPCQKSIVGGAGGHI